MSFFPSRGSCAIWVCRMRPLSDLPSTLSMFSVLFFLSHRANETAQGSVAKVRKRDRAKGGSARQAFVKEEHKGDCCFHIKNWLAWLPSWSGNAWMVPARTTTTTTKTNTTSTSGGDNDDELTPLKGSEESKHAARSSSNSNSNSYGKNMDSSFHSFASWSEWVDPKGRHRHNSSKPVNRKEFIHSHSSSLITFGTKKESYYALKSIHLDRCTSKEFVKELKNEGEFHSLTSQQPCEMCFANGYIAMYSSRPHILSHSRSPIVSQHSQRVGPPQHCQGTRNVCVSRTSLFGIGIVQWWGFVHARPVQRIGCRSRRSEPSQCCHLLARTRHCPPRFGTCLCACAIPSLRYKEVYCSPCLVLC